MLRRILRKPAGDVQAGNERRTDYTVLHPEASKVDDGRMNSANSPRLQAYYRARTLRSQED